MYGQLRGSSILDRCFAGRYQWIAVGPGSFAPLTEPGWTEIAKEKKSGALMQYLNSLVCKLRAGSGNSSQAMQLVRADYAAEGKFSSIDWLFDSYPPDSVCQCIEFARGVAKYHPSLAVKFLELSLHLPYEDVDHEYMIMNRQAPVTKAESEAQCRFCTRAALAECYSKAGNIKQAHINITELGKSPHLLSVEICRLAGNVESQCGDSDFLEYLRTCVERKPPYASANSSNKHWLRLANYYEGSQDFLQAESCFEKALNGSGSDSHSLFDYCRFLEAHKTNEQAIAALLRDYETIPVDSKYANEVSSRLHFFVKRMVEEKGKSSDADPNWYVWNDLEGITNWTTDDFNRIRTLLQDYAGAALPESQVGWKYLTDRNSWGDKEYALLKQWMDKADLQGRKRILDKGGELAKAAGSYDAQLQREFIMARLMTAFGEKTGALPLYEQRFYMLVDRNRLKEAEEVFGLLDSKNDRDRAFLAQMLSAAAAKAGNKQESLRYWRLKDSIHPCFSFPSLRDELCRNGMSTILLEYYEKKPVGKAPKDEAGNPEKQICAASRVQRNDRSAHADDGSGNHGWDESGEYERYRTAALRLLRFEQLFYAGELQEAEKYALAADDSIALSRSEKCEQLSRLALACARWGHKSEAMRIWAEKDRVSPKYYSAQALKEMCDKYAMKESLLHFYEQQPNNRDQEWYQRIMKLLR